MSYYLPSDSAIIKIIINYELDSNPFTTSVISEGINRLIKEVDSAAVIANLNHRENYEYIHYLKYFRKYVQVSYNNENSSIRSKLEDHYKLKELHKLL